MIGRYQIEKLLGKGNFGEVYRAIDSQLDRSVAIKLTWRDYDEEHAQLFLAEAKMLASLDHPHILPVFDVGRHESGAYYVVSKLIDGSDLETELSARKFDVKETTGLVASIADALHHAHQRGLVHRDVKPANILLDKGGSAYLADFGISLSDDDLGRGPGYAGTPCYMSPEQVSGNSHRLDGRADIFSLGVVLYEMLSGKKPFRADSRDELVHQITSMPPKPLRQTDDAIPVWLEESCQKALSKQVEQRYSTATDFAEALRDKTSKGNAVSENAVVPSSTESSANRSWSLRAKVFVGFMVALFVVIASYVGMNAFNVDRAISVDILTQRSQGEFQPINSLLPLRPGDFVRFDVQLNRPSYVRAYWINRRGEPLEIFVAEASGAEQRSVRSLESPTEPDLGWPVSFSADEDNHMESLVVVVDDQPIDDLIRETRTSSSALTDYSLPSYPKDFGDTQEEYDRALESWIGGLAAQFEVVKAIGIPTAEADPLKADFRLRISRDDSMFADIESFGALRNDDLVRFVVHLNRPANLRLIWVDSEGKPVEVFPNDPENGFQGSNPVSSLQSPLGGLAEGWPLEGLAGTEVCILLVGSQPLNSIDLDEFQLARLDQVSSPRVARFFATKDSVSISEPTATRSLGTKSRRVDNSVLQLMDKLRKLDGVEVVQVLTIPHVDVGATH